MKQTWWDRVARYGRWLSARPRRIAWFVKYGAWWRANRPAP